MPRGILLLAAMASLVGCGRTSGPRDERPRVLRYVYNPSADEVEVTKARYAKLAKYLEKKLAMPVDMVVGAGYGATVEAMRAKKVDAGTMGPMAFLLAERRAQGEVLVVPGTKESGPSTYQSCIIVRADSPIQTIDQLLSSPGKYTFAFVDPASTSGHLLPRAYMEGRGLEAEKYFKKLHYSTTHPTTLFTVLGGKVDAGATMPTLLKMFADRGKMKEGEVRVLWTSPAIPTSPVVVRGDLPQNFKEELRDAFLTMADDDPALSAELGVASMSRAPGSFRFFAVSSEAYEGLRTLAREIKTMRLIE